MTDGNGSVHVLNPDSVEVLKQSKSQSGESQGATLYTASGRVVHAQKGVEELLHELPLMLFINEGVPREECWINPSAVKRIVKGTPTQIQMRSGISFSSVEDSTELRKRKRRALEARRS